MRLGLCDQRVGFGLERLHGVSAGSEASWWFLERCELHNGFSELGWVPTLLSIHALPSGNDLFGSLSVVVNGRLGVGGRVGGEQLGTKKPGSTSIVRMPNRATSGVSDSIHPSMPNFAAAYAGTKHLAGDACGRGDGHQQAGALLTHHREDSSGDVHRAEQQRIELIADLLGAQLLEEAGEEVSRVIDQNVNSAKLRDSGIDRRLRIVWIGDVEFGCHQAFVIADCCRDLRRLAAGGDNGMAGCQGCLGNVETQAATSAGD